MSKFYVNINGRNHISRTNIAECQTECGITLKVGQALTVSTPATVCQRCEESTAFTGLGPMSLPHYLEAENQKLRDALAGEIGLVQLITGRPELCHIGEELLANHRHVAALEALGDPEHD